MSIKVSDNSDLLSLPFDLRTLILPHGEPRVRLVCKALRDEFDGLNRRLGRVRLLSSSYADRESICNQELQAMLNLVKRTPKLSHLR
jgi:hypothetical protein